MNERWRLLEGKMVPIVVAAVALIALGSGRACC